MENNNMNYQSQGYYQGAPYQMPQGYQAPMQSIFQAADPNYEIRSGKYLKSGILNLCFCWLPVGSIICMIKAKKTKKEIKAYCDQGNPHIGKIKSATVLLSTARGVGMGFTIYYGFLSTYMLLSVIFSALGIMQ